MKEYHNTKEFFRLFGDGKTKIRWTGWPKACNDYVVVEKLNPYEKKIVKGNLFKSTGNQEFNIDVGDMFYWERVEEFPLTAAQRDKKIIKMITELNESVAKLTKVVADLQQRVGF